VELITPHRTTNHHETRKGGQGPVWAVAPLIIIILVICQLQTANQAISRVQYDWISKHYISLKRKEVSVKANK
jgi:hypothetical protein